MNEFLKKHSAEIKFAIFDQQKFEFSVKDFNKWM